MDVNNIMVLADGETFTQLDGCFIGRVLYDEATEGVLSEEEWDNRVEALTAEGRDWASVWDGGPAVIVEVVKRFGADDA